MKTWLIIGVTLGLGAAAGALVMSGSVKAKALSASAQASPARREARQTPASTPALHDAQALQLSALNQRLAALESASAPPLPDTATDPERERQAAPSAAEVEQQHADNIAAIRAEAVDPEWSRTVGAALRNDFALLPPDVGATVKQVDCRSTSCIISFEWQSRDLAASQWRRVMQQTQAPCGRAIVVPQGRPDEQGPIEVSMVLDCTQWVAHGSSPHNGTPSAKM